MASLSNNITQAINGSVRQTGTNTTFTVPVNNVFRGNLSAYGSIAQINFYYTISLVLRLTNISGAVVTTNSNNIGGGNLVNYDPAYYISVNQYVELPEGTYYLQVLGGTNVSVVGNLYLNTP